MANETPTCPSCKEVIDPEVCWCGEYMSKHDLGSGHSPIEMGCTCYYGRSEGVSEVFRELGSSGQGTGKQREFKEQVR